MPVKFDVKLQKVGNSFQVVVPKPAIEGLGWKLGDILSLTVTDNQIVVMKAKSK